MGSTGKGILDSIIGKVGTVVGAKWKGRTDIRSRPGPRKKGSFSQSQIEQQARFTQMMNFLLPISTLLEKTFGLRAKGMSGLNTAFAYNRCRLRQVFSRHRD
jgi:uncharacterized protein DUF6266